MSPRRGGWNYAQLKTTFLSDPEFQRLARRTPDDVSFLSAVGLWTCALARAWAEDSADIGSVMDAYDAEDAVIALRTAGLIDSTGEKLRGFDKWTDGVRRERQADADRKAAGRGGLRPTPPDSGGLPANPPDAPRVEVVVVEEVVVAEKPRSSSTTTAVTARERPKESSRTMTKEEYDRFQAEWSSFGSKVWDPFKKAWIGRDLFRPPAGDPDDDSGTTQRSRLFRIADARPNDLGKWVTEAPGKTAHEVIEYVFSKWGSIEEEVGVEEVATMARQRGHRMEPIGAVLPNLRIVGKESA